jgi:hypothetical protein
MTKTQIKLIVPVVLLVMAAGMFLADVVTRSLMTGNRKAVEENSEVLPNKKTGFITRLYERDGSRFLDFDEVSWLTAAEGTCNAGKGAKPGAPACGADGYLIVNTDNQIHNWEVVASYVNTFSGPGDNVTIEYESFIHLPPDHFQKTIYEIQLVKEKVIKITEVARQ